MNWRSYQQNCNCQLPAIQSLSGRENTTAPTTKSIWSTIGSNPPGAIPILLLIKAPVKSPKSAPNGIKTDKQNRIILKTTTYSINPTSYSYCPTEKEASESLVISKNPFAIQKVSTEIHLCSASQQVLE